MSQKPNQPDYSSFRLFPGGFTLILTAIAILSVVILASVIVYSHYSYKNSQKKLFIEKWDSIAMRISREASSAINDAGLIDDDFASYLYWIPAVSKEIVAIKLVDNQNNPIYATGVPAPDEDLIDDFARGALDGRNRFLFPGEFEGIHTIIATPVYRNDKIEAILLLTVDDSPENIPIKSAVLKPALLAILCLSVWTFIIMLVFSWTKKRVDNAEKISQLQSRLSKPESEKSDAIIEKGLNDIMSVFDFKAGSIYIKNVFSGEFELKSYYPPSEKEARPGQSINFEPGDPCLQAITHNKLIIYENITKKPLLLKAVRKTSGDVSIAIPLTSETSIFGAINLTIPGKKRINSKWMNILKRSLEIYSSSILTALESEEKTSRINRLFYVLDMIELLGSADFIKTALGKISEKIASSTGVSFCSIFIFDEKNKRLILAAEAFSGEGLSFKPENIIVDLEEMPVHKVAMISGQSQILQFDEIRKLSLNKHGLYNPEMENSTIHIIPLVTGKIRIGCLSIGTVEEGDNLYNRKEYFENIAHYLSMVLKHIMRYSETKKSFEQLRSTHKRQLMLAKFSVISDLVQGVHGNLDYIMRLFLDDVKKMRDTMSDNSLREIAETIDSHINSYRSVLEKLENFASIKPIVKYRQMEVAHTLKKMENRLKEDSSKWPVNLEKIRIVVLNSGSGQILGDEDELYRAVSNIVINAAEAMPYGGDIVLESKIEKNMAIIEISDQGSGLNETEIKRIFEPFFTTKEGPARGLGLSMAQKILILHNGEIDVSSKPGKGCTFILTIPLTDPDQTALYTSKKKSSSSIPLSS